LQSIHEDITFNDGDIVWWGRAFHPASNEKISQLEMIQRHGGRRDRKWVEFIPMLTTPIPTPIPTP
jgi:hypothetical protein